MSHSKNNKRGFSLYLEKWKKRLLYTGSWNVAHSQPLLEKETLYMKYKQSDKKESTDFKHYGTRLSEQIMKDRFCAIEKSIVL
jgi:hypothetical protein